MSMQYIVLSLLATILIMFGILGRFVPELLFIVDDDIGEEIKSYWLHLIVLGLVLGMTNAYLTVSFTRQRNDDRWCDSRSE
ncbi:MAG: hypothetical protein ABFS08_11230 [Pseudomonadota bacterium]